MGKEDEAVFQGRRSRENVEEVGEAGRAWSYWAIWASEITEVFILKIMGHYQSILSRWWLGWVWRSGSSLWLHVKPSVEGTKVGCPGERWWQVVLVEMERRRHSRDSWEEAVPVPGGGWDTRDERGVRCQGWPPRFGSALWRLGHAFHQAGGMSCGTHSFRPLREFEHVQGHPQTLMMFSVCFSLQRAKINQGTKAPEEKTTNTISKFDNNGNRDRMKLTDFNFLMVLGKGSFGKVQYGWVVTPAPEGTANKAGTFAVHMGLTFQWGREWKVNRATLQLVMNTVREMNGVLCHRQIKKGPTQIEEVT